MNISEKKKSELYGAVHDPIMDYRITIQQSKDILGDKNSKDIDEALFRLNMKAWKNICTVLGIND